jgi:outer membrane immunogenic protein
MSSTISALTLFAIAALATTPGLAAESGFYVGGGIGQSTFQEDLPSGDDFDESDTGWKAFAGYRLGGYIPIIDFAGELTYRDFGNPDGRGAEFEATGYDASALGIVTLGPIDLFARLGIGNYSVEGSGGGLDTDDDSTSEIYGVGAGFSLGKLAIRVEWERVEPDGVENIDMYSINAYWRF